MTSQARQQQLLALCDELNEQSEGMRNAIASNDGTARQWLGDVYEVLREIQVLVGQTPVGP